MRLFRIGFVPVVALAIVAGGWQAARAEKPAFVKTTVENTTPRLDVDGNPVDAHDGCLQFFDGRYYLYGTAYGKTAGFTTNSRYRVYSSVDMAHWRLEGELLQAPPEGVYYRPYVVFNAKTRKYVLWYNWYRKLWDGQVGVAESDTPVGPFAIVNDNVQLARAAKRPGDGSLFVDEDGSGYFVYTTIGEGHAIRVEKLTEDYHGSSGAMSEELGKGCEAPALFRRGATYYALFDQTCCFCKEGSGARVLTAASPLGPYRQTGNINRDAAGKPVIPAQQTFVARVETPEGSAYIWMGDEWRSTADGVKGHDLQYWSEPLKFNADGTIAPLQRTGEWTATVRAGRSLGKRGKPYAWPQTDKPAEIRKDPCDGSPLNERGEPAN